jgi:drug/metabolite transporter (DMT)-like permease
MILAMIAWGETWVSAKILSRYLDSDELIFWRFLFTALGLIPVLIYYKLSFKISKQNLFLSIMSAIILAFYNNAFFLGTKYGLASFGGVLVTTLNPIITFIIVSTIAKKIFNYKEIFGLLFGVIGALIILKIWSFDLNLILSQGNIYYLIASFLWPFLTIVTSYQKKISSLVFIFYMFSFTSIIDLIFIDFNITNIIYLDFTFWSNLLLLSLFGTTFATTIYFIAVTKLGSKLASSFFFLVPLSSIIFASIFLNEIIELSLALGGLLTVISVYILNQSKNVKDNKS